MLVASSLEPLLSADLIIRNTFADTHSSSSVPDKMDSAVPRARRRVKVGQCCRPTPPRPSLSPSLWTSISRLDQWGTVHPIPRFALGPTASGGQPERLTALPPCG